ncbi:MAG: T9SS type A sorting domain-containing protein [Bacteroidia bacterium]
MNTSLKKQLKRYSALSSASIAFLNTAHSQVVVTDVLYQGLPNSVYDIDLDNNGVVDFRLEHSSEGPFTNTSYSYYITLLKIDGVNDNKILMSYFNSFGYAGRLYSMENINDTNYFNISANIIYSDGLAFTAPKGNWLFGDCSTQDKYMGVNFDIDGANHYGWIRLSTKLDFTYYISNWAYETQPDTPIVTPAITNKSATNVVVTDISNNGDASDIQITFDRAQDEHDFLNQGKYKLFLSKSATSPDVATNTNFHEVVMDGSANYTVNLPSNFMDVDGNAIETNTEYYVYVFAVYSCEDYLSDVETITINGVVGVKDASATLSMTVYPNPTSGVMEIVSDEVMERIEITDLTGKGILNYELQITNYKLDISQLAEGVYYLKVQYVNGVTTYQKIIKK